MPPVFHDADRSRRRRPMAWLLLGSVVLVALAGLAWWQQQREAERVLDAQAQARALAEGRERGRQLFHDGAGLPGRPAGHAEDLPALATRCSNCHALEAAVLAGPRGAAVAGGSSASTDGAGSAPVLGPALLTSLRPRRGGPPSRFDAETLCRLLATGRDPALVVISVNMPRYAASPAQCQDLWHYLAPSLN